MAENVLDGMLPCHSPPSQDPREYLKCRTKPVTTDLDYDISSKYYVTISVSVINRRTVLYVSRIDDVNCARSSSWSWSWSWKV